jgi:hypothetical protein
MNINYLGLNQMAITDPSPKPGRGGARPGAGRPKKALVAPEATAARRAPGRPPKQPGDPLTVRLSANERFAIERARHEKIKADQRALKLKIESGEYIPREAVRRASAALLAQLAQAMRSLPDNLERRGLASDWCERIESTIDDVLDELAEALQRTSEQRGDSP